MYQWMIDRPNCTHWKEQKHVFKLIHVSSTTGVSVVYGVCQPCRMCVSVKCACGAPSINQEGLGPAAEKGLQWATHPVERSGEIQCPHRFNALQMSLQLKERETEREKWEGGRERIGGYNPQSRPLAVSQPIALVWGILAGAPGALCCWVSFQNNSDYIYHFLSLALFPSHVISRQTAKYIVAKGVGVGGRYGTVTVI